MLTTTSVENLKSALTDAVVRRLATAEDWQDGLALRQSVSFRRLEPNAVEANVATGGIDSSVELWSDDGILQFVCDAEGHESSFCNHCVAAALAWLDLQKQPAVGKKQKRSKSARKLTLAEAGEILLGKDPKHLVQAILRWAEADPKLAVQVQLLASQETDDSVRIATVRDAIKTALKIEAGTSRKLWAARIAEAAGLVEELQREGMSEGALEASEYMLEQLEKVAQRVGDASPLIPTQERLEKVHYAAAMHSRPDPIKLARTLFEFQKRSHGRILDSGHTRYAKILGPSGLAEYRRLAEAEIHDIDVSTAGSWLYFTWVPFERILLDIAALEGDLDRQIEIRQRRLQAPGDYAELAEMYRNAGKENESVATARKAIQRFPEPEDTCAYRWLAEAYERGGDHAKAVDYAWREFRIRPSIDTFLNLKKRSEGAGDWAQVRAKAIQEIRKQIQNPDSRVLRKSAYHRIASQEDITNGLLARILLADGDRDAAWEVAQQGATPQEFEDLADATADTHPRLAIQAYMLCADFAVETYPTGPAYSQTAAVLLKLVPLMKSQGLETEWRRYFTQFQRDYKHKTKLMRILRERADELQ